jgi:hypothetical protein
LDDQRSGKRLEISAIFCLFKISEGGLRERWTVIIVRAILEIYRTTMLECDWKTIRDMVPKLRERYLAELNARLVGTLTDTQKNDTERFWDTLEEMERQARILEDCLDGHSRSRMEEYRGLMLGVGILTKEDIAVFSDELQSELLDLLAMRERNLHRNRSSKNTRWNGAFGKTDRWMLEGNREIYRGTPAARKDQTQAGLQSWNQAVRSHSLFDSASLGWLAWALRAAVGEGKVDSRS